MTRRIITIAAAVLLAVLGAAGVLEYVHQADQRALSGMRAVNAYVATAQIPAGAVRSITPTLSGMVLTSGLASGQILLNAMLGASVQTASALPIPPGMVAVTLQLCVQQAVGNYITPGSQIAVFNTFVNGTRKTATGACSQAGAGAGAETIQTRMVMSKVLVLAV